MFFCLSIACLSGLFDPGLAVSAEAQNSSQRVPNVVFILADDLGWRDTSVYGSQYYQTPHIARLAERGMTFTNAYSASPLCSATRASILTGLWPARLRLTTADGHLPNAVLDPTTPERGPWNQPVVTPETRTRLPNEYLTSGKLLKKAGYTTAFMGKWHLGQAPHLPENQGFQVVVGGQQYPGPPGGYFSPFPNLSTIPKTPDGTHIDDILADQAVEFLKENRDRPFFLNLWFYSVHDPFQAKQALIEKARKRTSETATGQNCPTMAAMVETLDTNVGKVIDTLDQLGLTENTLIIFTSDNGGNMHSEVDGTIPTDNAPLRSGKGSIYEGGHRVPLIVVWPGKAPAGVRSDVVVTSVDFLPTLAEAVQRKLPEHFRPDGLSLLPVLQGADSLPREAVFCHFPHYMPTTGNRPATSIREGDLKLIRFYGDNPDGSDRLELYDLKADLSEQKNLAEIEPEKASQLNQKITEFLTQTEALVPIPNPVYMAALRGWSSLQPLTIQERLLLIPGERELGFSLKTSDVPLINRPATLRLRVKSAAPVQGKVAWVTAANQADLKAQRHCEFTTTQSSSEWQEILLHMPIKGQLDELQLEFAPSQAEILVDSLEMSLPGTLVKRWEFTAEEE